MGINDYQKQDLMHPERFVKANFDPKEEPASNCHFSLLEEWHKINELYQNGKYPNDEDVRLWMFSNDQGKQRVYFWYYESSGLGHFEKALMEAISKADQANLERLRTGFPETVNAFELYRCRRS